MRIELNQGKAAFVDDADADLVGQHRWYVVRPHRNQQYEVWYATTRINGRTVYMHRLIMGAVAGQQVDHRDQDGLNNRRDNLRFATPSEQQRNTRAKRKRSPGASRHKGVSRHETKKRLRDGTVKVYARWRAEVELPGRKRVIRYAKTEDEAARLYADLCREHFGEFARPGVV